MEFSTASAFLNYCAFLPRIHLCTWACKLVCWYPHKYKCVCVCLRLCLYALQQGGWVEWVGWREVWGGGPPAEYHNKALQCQLATQWPKAAAPAAALQSAPFMARFFLSFSLSSLSAVTIINTPLKGSLKPSLLGVICILMHGTRNCCCCCLSCSDASPLYKA